MSHKDIDGVPTPSSRIVGLLVLLAFTGLGYGATLLVERSGEWRDDAALIARTTSQTSPNLPPSQKTAPTLADNTDGLHFAEWTDSGIDFVYENGADNSYHLAETLGGGVTATDYDRDGHADLVFVDGGNPVDQGAEGVNRISLYRRTTVDRFTNTADAARCHWPAYGHGCAVGDLNNDGFDDLFFTGYGATALYINLGDGTFQETAAQAGLATDRWCATACFGDLDSDGDLDLYVTAYADVPKSLPARYCEEAGVRIHCHPHYYDAVPDLLFENLGDGRFTDRSVFSGIAEHVQYGLGVVIVDLNNDRVPEIFIANDGDRNLLFKLREDWQYDEIATTAGVAYSGQGQTMGAMGIACADFDGNGLLDLMTTNFIRERNVVFSNDGDLLFFDRSAGGLIDETSTPRVGWSAVPFDADNDGILDLFVANGHVTPSPSADYKQTPLLYHGFSGGEWKLASAAGEYFVRPWHGRGAIAVDLNGDGQQDLVVSHIRDQAALLINNSQPQGNVITLSLIGTASNRSAVTTQVEYEVAGKKHVVQRILSGGYLSGSTTELHLSLGSAGSATAIRIHWPSGKSQEIKQVEAGRTLHVVEGTFVLIPSSP